MGNNAFKGEGKKTNNEVMLSDWMSQTAYRKNVLDFYLCVAIVNPQEKKVCLPSIQIGFCSRKGKKIHACNSVSVHKNISTAVSQRFGSKRCFSVSYDELVAYLITWTLLGKAMYFPFFIKCCSEYF